MLRTILLALTVSGLSAAAVAQESGEKPAARADRIESDTAEPASNDAEGTGRKNPVVKPGFVVPVEPPKEAPVEELSDPEEILKRSAEVLSRIVRIHYEATLRATGALAPSFGTLWGTMMMEGFSNGSPKKFRMMIKGRVPGPMEMDTAMVGSDGKVFFLIDVKNKTVTDSYDPAVMGDMGKILPHFAVHHFVDPDRFKKELAAEKLEYLGVEYVGDKPAYKIRVANADESDRADWYFAQEGMKPLRYDRVWKQDDGVHAGVQIHFGPMALNPATQQDPFVSFMPKPVTPGEYTRIGAALAAKPEAKESTDEADAGPATKDDGESSNAGTDAQGLPTTP